MENVQIEGNVVAQEDLIEEIEDVVAKLNDCIQTLNEGKELDQTQKAFLKMHNV